VTEVVALATVRRQRAHDRMFSPRKPNTNARSLNLDAARAGIETIYAITPSARRRAAPARGARLRPT
jgi:hypothetical protein